MKLQRKNYEFLLPPVGPYVHAVHHNDVLHISGLTAFGTDAQNAPIEIQAKEIFDQIEKIAKAEGSDLNQLIKITAFVTELDNMLALRDMLIHICENQLPASSLIQVAGLFAPHLKIEIEATIATGRTQ